MACRQRGASGSPLPNFNAGWSVYRLLFLFFALATAVNAIGFPQMMSPAFPGTTTCIEDEAIVQFSTNFNTEKWLPYVVDDLGAAMPNCTYTLDLEKLILKVPYETCAKTLFGGYKVNIKVQKAQVENEVNIKLKDNSTDGEQSVLGHWFICPATRVEQIREHSDDVVCMKDFVSFFFPQTHAHFADDNQKNVSQRGWIIEIGNGTRAHTLALKDALRKGFSLLIDSHKMTLQVPLSATGIAHYVQGASHLYVVLLKFAFFSPSQQITFTSQAICVSDVSVACNATHMTLAIPEFPGKLKSVSIGNRSIPMSQLHESGINREATDSLRLHFRKALLQTKASEKCPFYQFHLSSLKLTFHFEMDTVSMVIDPECECESPVSIDELCTPDGFMELEVYSYRTKPALNLGTLMVGNSSCQPIFEVQSRRLVKFRIPLNGCGTRQNFQGDKVIYENEIHALWKNLPPSVIVRDSEFRMTVKCHYNRGSMILNANIKRRPPPVASVKSGPLVLVLQTYPDKSYQQPYGKEEYPIVRYLRQPIYMEVTVLNRNDPNIKLVLDDCWATSSVDPASLPQWHIVVDGCEYDVDHYKTTFHPVDSSMTHPHHYQRFDVKTFAFVSEAQGLSSLVYFHCSALICNRFSPDSPLCSVTCPASSRSKRGATEENKMIVSLPGPILLIPDEPSSEVVGGPRGIAEATASGTVAAAAALVGVATIVGFLCYLRKKRAEAE